MTTPASWGDWPPAQARIDSVVARAERGVRDRIAALWPGETVRIAVLPATVEQIDLVYCDGVANSGPASEVVTVGEIRAIGKQTRFLLRWNPANDSGYAEQVSDFNPRPGDG